MSKSIICKEGDLILLTSSIYKKGAKDEAYNTYTGVVSYITDNSIGFKCAVKHTIYKNGSTHTNILNDFNITRKYQSIQIVK